MSFNLAGNNLTDKVYYSNLVNRHLGGNNFTAIHATLC